MPYYTRRDLIRLRSDEGDGGWSLHTQEQIDIAKANDDAPDYLVAGPAEWNKSLNHGYGGWSRPNADDYAEAFATLEKTP